MDKRILFSALALTIAAFTTPNAEAAKGDKRAKRGERAAAMMLGRFDRDNSGSLDEKESQRVRNLFSALKKLDTDNNGELSASEIKSAKVEKPRRKAGKRKKQSA